MRPDTSRSQRNGDRRPASKPKDPVNFNSSEDYVSKSSTSTNHRSNSLGGFGLVAIFLCLRSCEYASTPGTSKHYISICDVKFVNKHGEEEDCIAKVATLKVFFRSSKADQTGRGCTRCIEFSGCSWLCPVRTSWSIAKSNKKACRSPGDPFMMYIKHDGTNAHISRHQISSALKRTAIISNLDAKCYSSHSLRIGGATALFLGGASDLTVQLFGRWSSNVYKSYTRINQAKQNKIAAMMVVSTNQQQ